MARTKIDRKDWRALPYEQWNTLTVIAYFTDMNRELFGAEYVPLRNWSYERGVIKRALDAHGAAVLRRACDIVFREYRPSREYPLLTAGFAISYRINSVIPRVKADLDREEAAEAGKPDVDAVKAWL